MATFRHRPIRPINWRREDPTRSTRIRKFRDTRTVGPGEPPAGFLGPWNSRSEWILYWAFSKVFDDPPDPRQPPFTGGERWIYQKNEFGGRSQLGGQVVDFVVKLQGRDIAVDLVSQQYHLYISPQETALDHARLLSLARYYEVVSIQEVDVILDPTGQQAVENLVRALGGRSRIGPRSGGPAYKARRGRLFGATGEYL